MLFRSMHGRGEDETEAVAKQAGRQTILLAPSWGQKRFLSCYGPEFIGTLARADFNIILRPHPQSWRTELALLRRIERYLSAFDNVTWDKDSDPSRSLLASDILISDTSAIRLDYAMIYGKPVISLETEIGERDSFEIADLPPECMDSLADRICVPVGRDRIDHIVEIVGEVLCEGKMQGMEDVRRRYISCFGCAGKQVAEYLVEKSVRLSVPQRDEAEGKKEAHNVV